MECSSPERTGSTSSTTEDFMAYFRSRERAPVTAREIRGLVPENALEKEEHHSFKSVSREPSTEHTKNRRPQHRQPYIIAGEIATQRTLGQRTSKPAEERLRSISIETPARAFSSEAEDLYTEVSQMRSARTNFGRGRHGGFEAHNMEPAILKSAFSS